MKYLPQFVWPQEEQRKINPVETNLCNHNNPAAQPKNTFLLIAGSMMMKVSAARKVAFHVRTVLKTDQTAMCSFLILESRLILSIKAAPSSETSRARRGCFHATWLCKNRGRFRFHTWWDKYRDVAKKANGGESYLYVRAYLVSFDGVFLLQLALSQSLIFLLKLLQLFGRDLKQQQS